MKKLRKTFYVTFQEIFEEIKLLCNFSNARACINLNRRSFEKVAFQNLKKVTDQILNKDWKSVRKAYESVCGACNNEKAKKWIIDIDTKSLEFINKLETCLITDNNNLVHIYSRLQTINGFHLIIAPFDSREFLTKFKVDIQKDNPTLLYYNNNKITEDKRSDEVRH